MFRRTTLLLSATALVGGLITTGAAQANPCTSDGNPATGVSEIETVDGTYYIDDRGAVIGNGVWVYKESNGVAGLQRGGRSTAPGPLAENEICNESPNPDTLIL